MLLYSCSNAAVSMWDNIMANKPCTIIVCLNEKAWGWLDLRRGEREGGRSRARLMPLALGGGRGGVYISYNVIAQIAPYCDNAILLSLKERSVFTVNALSDDEKKR
jgi:hypothetical protein